jgi:DNA-binding IclR family transcriptional regulator
VTADALIFLPTVRESKVMAGNSADAGRSVTSKVIAILLTFTTGKLYSLSEVARLTGLPISTTHRLATELAAWGMLERTDDGLYRAGQQLKILGSRATLAPIGIQEKARRVMEDLATATGRNPVRLGVLRDLEVAYIEKLAGTRPVSMFYDAATAPAHATAMGKALLAFSPARVVDMVIARGLERYTPLTLTSPERLRRSLGVTRLTRVAVARREWDLATSTVAVPVFGAGGEVVASLELQSSQPQDLGRLQPALMVAASSLSRDLALTRSRGYDALRMRLHLEDAVGGRARGQPPGAA